MTVAPAHSTISPDAALRRQPHKHRRGFTSSHVSMGAVRAATLLATVLATDRMKDPHARWVTIAGLGIASSIGEGIWREYVERKREDADEKENTVVATNPERTKSPPEKVALAPLRGYIPRR